MLPVATLSLQINQQFAKMGLDFDKPVFEMRQPKAEVYIQQKPAQLEIDQGLGSLQIDGEDARAAVGHKPVPRMMEDIVNHARQIALNGIGVTAGDGDQLAAIEKGTTIADIALQHQDTEPMPIYEADLPSQVHVSFTPHPTRIDVRLGGVDITAIPHVPEIRYTPGAVHPYILQQNSLHIDVKGQYMNMTF